MNRVNPYTHMKQRFTEFCNEVFIRRRINMWNYPKDGSLRELYQRVAAAETLGWDVQINATDEALEVWYVKKLPKRPYGV